MGFPSDCEADVCLNLGVFGAFSFDAKSWFCFGCGWCFWVCFLCAGQHEELVSGFVKAFLGVMKFLFVCCALCLRFVLFCCTLSLF